MMMMRPGGVRPQSGGNTFSSFQSGQPNQRPQFGSRPTMPNMQNGGQSNPNNPPAQSNQQSQFSGFGQFRPRPNMVSFQGGPSQGMRPSIFQRPNFMQMIQGMFSQGGPNPNQQGSPMGMPGPNQQGPPMGMPGPNQQGPPMGMPGPNQQGSPMGMPGPNQQGSPMGMPGQQDSQKRSRNPTTEAVIHGSIHGNATTDDVFIYDSDETTDVIFHESA